MCLVCESRATCRTPFLKSHQCNPYLPHHLFRFNQIPVVSKRVRDHAEENHHQQQNLCISWNTVKAPGRCRCYQSSHVSTLIVLNFKVITCSEKFDNGAFARSYSFKVIVSQFLKCTVVSWEDSARTRYTNITNTTTALILASALCGLEVEKRHLQRKAKLLAAFLVLQLVLGVLLLLKWAV